MRRTAAMSARSCIVLHGADLGRDDLQQEFETVPARTRRTGAHDRSPAPSAQRRRVVGVAEAQDLDDVVARPFRQPADIGPQLGLQRQRAGAGPFAGPADPEARVPPRQCSASAPERPSQRMPKPGRPSCTRSAASRQSCLKAPIRSGVGAAAISSNCARWSKAKTRMVGPVAGLRFVAQWICSSSASLRRSVRTTAAAQEELQLLEAGIGRRAAVAATPRRPRRRWRIRAPVGQSSPSSQPLQQARHEAVAGAQHVEHLDGEARAGLAVVEAGRDLAREGRRARARRACRRASRP